MNDDSFISRLVDETYQILEERTDDVAGQLQQYLKNKTFYLNSRQIIFQRIEYLPSSSCFRIKLNDCSLDIPRNWSFFDTLYRALQQESDCALRISRQTDDDKLVGIFDTILPYRCELIFFVNNAQTFFLCLPINDREIGQEIRNFFQQSHKIAA